MSNTERLVASIVQFLGEQLRNDKLSSDGRESLEVAIQCLETAYNISASDVHLLPSSGLQEIFDEAVKNEPIKDTDREATYEERAEAERLKNDGNDLMRREQYEEALKCYTKAIQLDSKNAVYYCNRAAAYSKLNNHSFALEDCNRSLEIDPKYSKAYSRKGLAFASLNDHRSAKEMYEKALELEPYNENYLSNLKVAEEKIEEQQKANPFASMFGNNMDIEGLLSNPALMDMAQRFISDSNAQNFFGQMVSSLGNPAAAADGSAPSEIGAAGGAPGAEGADFMNFLRAGQQFAQQMQQNNPEIIETIRKNFSELGKKEDE